MAKQAEEDNAKKARRHTERVIKSLRPPTRLGKLVVWVAPYIVGPAVEYGVRFAEERGPELAAKGAAAARRKAPVAAAAVKEKAPAAAHAVVGTARKKAPVVARGAKDGAAKVAEKVRERRRARRGRAWRRSSQSAEGHRAAPNGMGADDWGGYEEPTSWKER